MNQTDEQEAIFVHLMIIGLGLIMLVLITVLNHNEQKGTNVKQVLNKTQQSKGK